MPNVTRKEIDEFRKKVTPRKPDYYWHEGQRRKPGYYNDGIDTYNIMVSGDFYLCVQLNFDTPDNVAEERVMERAERICPNIKAISRKLITIERVSSIPPRDGLRPRKVKKDDIDDNGLQRALDHIKHIKHRDIIVEDMPRPKGFIKVHADEEETETEPEPEPEDVEIIAIRRIDGVIETHSLKKYKYYHMLTQLRIEQCMAHNVAILNEGKRNIQKYRKLASRYIFPAECLSMVKQLELTHILEQNAFDAEDVNAELKREHDNYCRRRAERSERKSKNSSISNSNNSTPIDSE